MRKIKFRAWDKFNKKMVDFREERLTCYGEWWGVNWQEFYLLQNCDYNWMQYTWLKDKNWKEIYEWDILWSFWKWIEVLELEYWCFFWEVITDSWDKWERYFINDLCNDFHIAWNVYENPELLTK